MGSIAGESSNPGGRDHLGDEPMVAQNSTRVCSFRPTASYDGDAEAIWLTCRHSTGNCHLTDIEAEAVIR
jgi:hypothetical protein